MSKITFGYFLIFLNILLMFKIGNLSLSRGELGVFDTYVFIKAAIQLITLFYLIYQGALRDLFVTLSKKKRYYFILFYFFICFYSSIFISNSIKSLYFSFTILYSLLIISWVINNSSNKIVNKNWLELIFVRLYKVIIFSLVISLILFPVESLRLNFDNRLQSVILYVGSNGLAWFLFCFLIYYYLKKKKFNLNFFIILLLIFATQSRTSILLVSLFFILIIIKSRRIILLNFFLLLLVVIFSILDFQLFENLSLFFTRGENQLQSLSGRTTMWAYAIDLWRSNPLTGHGPWIGPYKSLLGTEHQGISQIHSSYVEILVSSGIIGFSCWLVFLLINWIKSIKNIYAYVVKKEKQSLIFIWCSFLMFFLPFKMYTSSVAVYFDHSMILFLLISNELFKKNNDEIVNV